MPVIAKKRAPEYLRQARLRAGCSSRGTATLKVPYSPETIGRHERGEVPVEPADSFTPAAMKARTSLSATVQIAPSGGRPGERRQTGPSPLPLSGCEG